MEKPLAVGAASGSVSAILWSVLGHLASEPLPAFSCPECPIGLESVLTWEHIDLPSLALGALIGLLLGPTVDLIQLFRQTWRVWLHSRLSALERAEARPGALYKIL